MRSILHCDMNNFYASVECVLNPELKKYPVAVCGSVEERHGIVLAKNYAARDMGVKVGEAVWQAKQKCPGLVVAEPHYEEYMKYSRLARQIYGRYTPQVESYGMDECWLDVSGTQELFGSAENVAYEIKEKVKYELGLTISVGVSFNKVFAKLGSDMKKPDAVTVITAEGFKEKIWGLPAGDLLGVGRSTQKKLYDYGIKTIGELANTNPRFLQLVFGKVGLLLWQFANGEESSAVMNSDFEPPVKSIGHGSTAVRDLKNEGEVWALMLELSQEIGHKLKVHQKRATGVAVFVRNNELAVKQWQCKTDYPTQSAFEIAKWGFELFSKNYSWLRDIRSVTVQAINLVPADVPIQTSLFFDTDKIIKREKIDACVEDIRRKFGNKSIRNCVLLDKRLIPMEKAEIIMPTGMIG